jgi:hypothetical protein
MSTYTSFIMHAAIATHFQYELKIVPTSFIYGSYHEFVRFSLLHARRWS